MIVTCESCKSRYKLDDAKITGRGAKITCPKCKNVFVVYAKQEGEAAPRPAVVEKPKPPAAKADLPGRVVASGRDDLYAPPPPPDNFDEDDPTRVGDANGAHELPRPAGTPGARPPAAKPPVETPGARAPGGAAARAASLDFRQVGVVTWKVKVKIGLVYDFSDIKTLRKYIQDGRVTAADVVSWDGKTWRAIGEIPDLDAFFVETWEMLAARREAAPDTLAPAAPAPEPKRAEEESAAATKSGGEPSQFQDPFAELRRKQKDRAEAKRTGSVPLPQAPTPAPPNRAPLLALGLVVLLALGGGWWWMNQAPPVAPLAPRTPAKATGPRPAGAPGDDAIKRIEDGLRNNLSPVPEDDAPGEAATENVPVNTSRPPPSTQELTPRVPANVPAGSTARAAKNPPPAGMVQADATAADHEAAGDDAARTRDWSTATMAYKKAVALDPRSGKLLAKLGRAQYESGDIASARTTLGSAVDRGAMDAHKYLGHIARADTDMASANNHYTEYLKAYPNDAEVNQIVNQ